MKGLATGCKCISWGAWLMVCGGTVTRPGRMTTPPVSLVTLVNGGLTMGSASSSSKFLGANMAKGMSKLVRVTWRDPGEYFRARPSLSLHASLEASRSLEVQHVGTPRLTTPPLPQVPVLAETHQPPPLLITRPQHKQKAGPPQTPGIQSQLFFTGRAKEEHPISS